MLGYYVRLVDYMAIETLVSITENCIKKFFLNMTADRKQRMFNTAVNYGTKAIMFNPPKEEFQDHLKAILNFMIVDVNGVTRVIWSPLFDPFVSSEQCQDFEKPERILKKSETFRYHKRAIRDKITLDFKEAQNFVDTTFLPAIMVHDFVETWDFLEYKKDDHSVTTIKTKMNELKDWNKDIIDKIPVNAPKDFKGVLQINGQKVRGDMSKAVTTAIEELTNYLVEIAMGKAKVTIDQLYDLNSRLEQQPQKLDEFIKFIQDKKEGDLEAANIDAAKTMIDEMQVTLRRERYKKLAEYQLKQDELNELAEKFKKHCIKAAEFIEVNKQGQGDKLGGRIEKLREDCVKISNELEQGPIVMVSERPDDALEKIAQINTKLDRVRGDATKYKDYQQILEISQTNIKEMNEVEQKYEQKSKIWNLTKTWSEVYSEWFLRQDFQSIDVEEMVKKVKSYDKDTIACKSRVPKGQKDEVVEALITKIKQVVANIGVIQDLGNKAIQPRHWAKIFDHLEGNPYVEGRGFTLNQLIEDGVFRIKDVVEEISAVASGEMSIETSLKEITEVWSKTKFETANYRDMRDRFIIGAIDDVMSQLEDHQVSIQTMLGSRYVVGIRDTVEEWDKKLKLIQDVIDEWLSCQKQWMYLENIFSAPDIIKQLPTEANKFQTVDKFWREQMMRTHKTPLIVEICTTEGLLQKFVKNNQTLDEIQKSLDAYLETKRLAFARFYFLADEELLEILSQTRNPHTVQVHLRKCFDNMDKIIFTDEPGSKTIVGMISGEQEKVPFSGNVMAEGNVEHWLTSIEDMMIKTLYDETKRAKEIYPDNALKRRNWFFEQKLPAQPKLTVDQIMWTYCSTEAVLKVENGENRNGVKDYYEFMLMQIGDMVEIVRGDLDFQQRTFMGALIVLDVHCRDVILEMVQADIKSIHDFEWQKQLQYYWDVEEDDCIVRQTNAKFTYGYEYLGNGPRLVITPLTDKCYLTLTGALRLQYGGAPAGPAGTGKTETTKDLGKALAYQCVVFNCSDGLDVKIMARFFSGLAQAGAWSCFDEFNRIDIEVLSVIAQQILQIQQAVRAGLDEFEFQARYITLNARFGVFITMNPGYAGRTELPDNLKALFRPVAMMIPDYGMIAEIILFSEGFEEARSLSRKMQQLYKLASEQLSKQDHYDFGMRAVKSVLVMAGQLKRKDPEASEDVVLIRAMRDSNVPKFLEADLPLFKGIIQDLFPGVEVPFIDYGDLQAAIELQLVNANMQKVDMFIVKIIQLMETMIVRHGNMLVGAASCGKSTIHTILSRALTQLNIDGSLDEWHQKVNRIILNPKSITMGQLYGETNTATGEFTDGLVPTIVRKAKQDETLDKHWVIFDGPVDSLWIESMNTVLDDSKTLCLVSGERIKIPATITMLFEVQDLAQASPATVSRCGMVYLEPIHLGWQPIITSWAVGFREQLPSYAEDVISNTERIIRDLMPFIREECTEMVPSVDINLVNSCLNLINSMIKEELISSRMPEDAEKLVNIYLAFCISWSLGANIHDNSRAKFERKFKFCVETLDVHYPDEGSIYDYCIDDDVCQFVTWLKRVPNYEYDSKLPFFNILVPTADTVRYKYVLDKLMRTGQHLLFTGETGVGKTVIVQNYLMNPTDKEEWYNFATVNFSAQTSTFNFYDVMMEKLDKRKKTLYGPPINKRMIIFVDDVNMPALDRYGSQPPVELLRQTIEGGFYENKKFYFINIIDTTFVACCAPPGGGRNAVSQRLFRHFNMIWQPQQAETSMEMIFGAILRGFLDEHPEENLSDHTEAIIKSSVECYVRITSDLLPTPTKSHYTFNLRDLSKVFQGVLQINYEQLPDKMSLVMLWLHESCRVFRDRLINQDDRDWFNDQLQMRLKKHLEIEMPKDDWVDIIFGDFMKEGINDYERIEYDDDLHQRLNMSLEKYNSDSTNMMNLVFFKDAIGHLARIARVLGQPRGNALLIGVGGSGRQSLARLAICMANFDCFSIEITRQYGIAMFHEDLKQLLLKAGKENLSVCFLFNDSQIVHESFLEDINNILNTGEVPNLFEQAEIDDIMTEVWPLAKEAGKIQTKDVIWAHFVQLVRENLHIVLAFSPVGEQFRVRCRQFPSIINCCTLDWYNAWPDDALYSVAIRFFEGNEDLGVTAVKDQLAKMCVEIHSSVTVECERFYAELRRRNYTTPTSYIELIKLYMKILGEQQTLVPVKINRYKTGLKRLRETNESVAELQEQLVELQPVLVKSKADNEELMADLQVRQGDAKIQEEACAKDELECSETMKEVQEIKDDCQRDLDEALPALHAAVKALDSLDKNSIVEMKSYTQPPPAVEMVMNAVLILFKKKTSWPEGKALLSEMGFLDKCREFDKDGITKNTQKKLQVYIKKPDFNRQSIEAKSIAAASLCEWVCAMDKYSKVAQNIEPKKKKLAEAEKQLKQAQDKLAEKQAILRKVQNELAELQNNYEASVAKAEDLQRRSELTEARLVRAEKLVSGLSSEQVRWKSTAEILEEDMTNLVGNMILSSGYISYLGPFTLKYRIEILDKWITYLQDLNIKCATDFAMEKILADPVEIREWMLAGLPADRLSVENGIVVTKGGRWPLIMDPQGQANRWIKSMNKEISKTIKLSESNFLKTLENGIRFGQHILLENVEEVLDPSLEPVLQKQVFKRGGQYLLHLGDSDIPYSSDFRFYITTKLPNPHYLPEICIKVTVVNFTVTPDGLEDQLLVDVVRVERPDLEELKNKLIVQISNDKDQLSELEAKILQMISDVQGEILDDEVLIETLGQSKRTSELIKVRMTEAEQTAKEIDTAREQYRIVATRGSLLYFVIADMGLVDPMYQYSLEFFNNLFIMRLEKSEQSEILEKRLDIIIEDITRSYYLNICRGLFEVHKLLFSFLNAVRITMKSGKISEKEWNFYLAGAPDDKNSPEFEGEGITISKKVWRDILALETVHINFQGLSDSFKSFTARWSVILESDTPALEKFPPPFDEQLTPFQRMMLLKFLREERMIFFIKEFVKTELGPIFIESPPFDLDGAYEDSRSMTPIIFVLSPGASPIEQLISLAKEHDMDGPRFKILSLGRGQGKIAEKMIENGRRNGEWICLQNCHLAASWMSELERIQEQQVEQDTHADYRLWLTSDPSKNFPVPVLQNGIKITNEPPKGLKANLSRTFQDISQEAYDVCKKQVEYRRLLFSLAFFHAVILERRKFGPIGWNIAYQWMNSDFTTSQSQLLINLDEQPDVPFKALNYIVSVVNYGGRVTDDKDVRTMAALLSRYFRPEALEPGFKFSESGIYSQPDCTKVDQVQEYISSLPLDDDPEVFGLHTNADITFQQTTVKNFLNTLIMISPKGAAGSSGKSSDEVVAEMAAEIEAKVPELLNKKEAHELSFAIAESGAMISLGVFLDQEIDMFNILTAKLKQTLVDLQKAIKGYVVMSLELENMYKDFLINKVPQNWEDVGYPSLKPLSSWVSDYSLRMEFMLSWLVDGPPVSFWLSAFFFPQGFMTATLQTYARKTQIPIDTLRFRAESRNIEKSDLRSEPADGVNIHGLFLQGCKWDWIAGQYVESDAGVLFEHMPVIWLEPIKVEDAPTEGVYITPLYKTSNRWGVLNTTGMSTNFVMFLDLPTTEPADHWVRRGVALLCMLDT